MSFTEHRQKLLEQMEDQSIALVYAGVELHANEDNYHDFQVNSQFFWLTGLERQGMILLLTKFGGETKEMLFIEEMDPDIIRWTGKMPSIEEAAEVSGMEDIYYLEDLPGILNRMISRQMILTAYFDVFRNSMEDLPDYNLLKAQEFKEKMPAVVIKDLHNLVFPLRCCKDEDEIADIRRAICITKESLEDVMSELKPGMKEYQVQAVFEYGCRKRGAVKQAFPTIAGSGPNGCMLHYETNRDTVEDGTMILLDLGAKYNNYCSDITRTYPASGKYSERQRAYYDIVLKANQAVAAAAKPGMTLRDLNELTKQVLGEGLMELGKIEDMCELGDYYMHGVSHSIGIDVHDINMGTLPLQPGWVISNEPGLYVDDEGIGIRIEDDLLITEDGCVCLSQDVIRDPDEIEAFMASHKK